MHKSHRAPRGAFTSIFTVGLALSLIGLVGCSSTSDHACAEVGKTLQKIKGALAPVSSGIPDAEAIKAVGSIIEDHGTELRSLEVPAEIADHVTELADDIDEIAAAARALDKTKLATAASRLSAPLVEIGAYCHTSF